MDILEAYISLDRRQALAAGLTLPEHCRGAALFADIAGFTSLAENLTAALGPQRGAEELTGILNTVYDAIITDVHRYDGNVIGFNGDGLVCWFDRDRGTRAIACGLAMHYALSTISSTQIVFMAATKLSLKAGIAVGAARRFLVGDPSVQQFDLLVGDTLNRMALAEECARQGTVVVAADVVEHLGERLQASERRGDFYVVERLIPDELPIPRIQHFSANLTGAQMRPFLHPLVYERLIEGQGEFLAELRPATVLFLGFGGIDYDRDHRAGYQLDLFVRWVQAVLGRYEGSILQMTTCETGSYLYAAFGAPLAHEDDARRAVAAARELTNPPAEFGYIKGLRVGISQGKVWAGAYGSRTRRTYGVLGDEVNVASRLMQMAPAGEALCTQRVCQAAGPSWIFEPLPSLRVKGKSRPIRVYRPVGRSGENSAPAEKLLVGRLQEMKRLADLAAEIQSVGQCRILLLEGEAGIGKSRLVNEMAHLVQRDGVVWLQGAGQSIEQQTPYRAWRDVFESCFHLNAQMSQVERQHQVQEWFSQIDPDLIDRAPLFNDILHLALPESELTRHLDASLRHESLKVLVVDVLRDLTNTAPLALVLEDAHWLDSLSWELALTVARSLQDRPLLLILALRPLEKPTRAEYAALAALSGVETMELGAMGPNDAVSLAANCLGLHPDSLPPEVSALIQERAEGNPFFAEEIAHALRDRGAIVVDGGTCVLNEGVATLRENVPDTVEGVVLARIDRLPPDRQLLLKVAAVIGRTFLYRTLRDIHPHRVMDELLREHLTELSSRDLTPLQSLQPELTYIFKHIITQQVAYDTLLFAQRRELHRAAAHWYEKIAADDLAAYAPLLAHHWGRSENVEREAFYASMAGKQAAAQYANAEAVAYLSRALDLIPQTDIEQYFGLLLARENVWHLLGERERQEQDIVLLEDVAVSIDHAAHRAEAGIRRARFAETMGDYPSSVAAAQSAVAQADAATRPDLGAEAYLQWGIALRRQSDYDAAWERLEEALKLAQKAGREKLGADILRSQGIICVYRGSYQQALDYFRQALKVYGEVGARRGESEALNNLGTTYDYLANYEMAREYYLQALQVCHEIGYRRGEGDVLNNLGVLADSQGNYDLARSYYTQCLQIYRQIGYRQGEGWALANLASLFYVFGDYQPAIDYSHQALDIHCGIGDRQGEASELAGLSMIYHYIGNDSLAQEYGQRALTIARDLGNVFVEGHALTYLGHALLAQGKPADAAAIYREAIELRKGADEHTLAMESLAGLASALVAQRDLAGAGAAVDEILAYLEDHNLEGAYDPMRVYWTCYQVLETTQQDARAWKILSAAYDLLQARAAKIQDAEMRWAYLNNVAYHRKIVEVFEAGL